MPHATTLAFAHALQMTVGTDITRFLFLRCLAFVYLIAFAIAVNQFRGLCGERGLLPAPAFLRQIRFRDSPSLFFLGSSDRAFFVFSWIGLLLSILALSGLSDAHGYFLYSAVWFLLWAVYLSFVNIGQTFYGFGWETLLLETGFLAIFLGPMKSAVPVVFLWLIRWILFRVMFGAGMIKIRADPCWRDLTCMYYHYETQPLPNPLSRAFHRLPQPVHRYSVLFNHFIELVVPFGFFGPQPVAAIAGGLTILFQLILIFSGNLSWLNYITIVLCIACFSDSQLMPILSITRPSEIAIAPVRFGLLALVTAFIAFLSIRPARNLLGKSQLMNASFDPLHLVNTYGAFGSITRERMEVILEGTEDSVLTSTTVWREYEFKGKPGNVRRMPLQVSPYHFKLDWQMWFAAMSSYIHHPWILHLVAKLLRGDRAILKLMDKNPFPDQPPRYIRAQLYLYTFAEPGEKRWWNRTLMAEYLPPLSLENASFRSVLQRMNWE